MYINSNLINNWQLFFKTIYALLVIVSTWHLKSYKPHKAFSNIIQVTGYHMNKSINIWPLIAVYHNILNLLFLIV